jgi:hypothetical protein
LLLLPAQFVAVSWHGAYPRLYQMA